MKIQENNTLLREIKERLTALLAKLHDTSAVTATSETILEGYTAVDKDGAEVTGNMANNGAVDEVLTSNRSYTIPKGYHNGLGKVTANVSADNTYGNAAASEVLSGKTFLSGGVQRTGTMSNRGAVTDTLTYQGDSYTIPKGYHDGNGKVTANFSSGTLSVPSITIDNDGVITAKANVTGSGYLAYGTSKENIKTIPAGTLAKPTISVDNSGVVTATGEISSGGYMKTGVTEENTYTLPGAKISIINPGGGMVGWKVTSAGYEAVGNQGLTSVENLDSNFIASNIRKGITIFGIEGTYGTDFTVDSLYNSNMGFTRNSAGSYSSELSEYDGAIIDYVIARAKISFHATTVCNILITLNYNLENAYAAISNVDVDDCEFMYFVDGNISWFEFTGDCFAVMNGGSAASKTYSMEIPAGDHYIVIEHAIKQDANTSFTFKISTE